MVDQLTESQFNQVRCSGGVLLSGRTTPNTRPSQLKEAFTLLDTDGDGILTSNDVQVISLSAVGRMSLLSRDMQLFLTSFNHTFTIDEIDSFLSE
jgi:Ca2+-binding EF-hand superfamily protein